MSSEFKAGHIFEETIEKLALGGKGIVHINNVVVFVKGALPGQKVQLQITKSKKNYAEAKLLKVLSSSPIEHISPYERMPGCIFQNVQYEDQLSIKQQLVFETLEHLGNIDVHAEDIKILPIIPSPETIRYRNKIEFSFGYEEMRIEIDKDGKKVFHDLNPSLGFHPEGKWALVQSIKDCFLASENMNLVRSHAEEIMKASKFSVWNPKIHRGFWRNLILRESKANGEILVNFVVSKNKPSTFWDKVVTTLKNNLPCVSGILVTIHTGKSDFIADPDMKCIWGEDFLLEKIGKTQYKISPFSFFQTNTLGAKKLFEVIQQFAELSENETVMDIFCGSGAIGLFLAKNAKHIIGLEMEPHAVRDAIQNAELNSAQNTEYFCGKAEQTLLEVLQKYPDPDVLIVDPPRSGVHPKAMKILQDIPAKKMVFISCNPATLARDLSLLRQMSWKIQKLQVVDMFPHTPHIETVVQLIR